MCIFAELFILSYFGVSIARAAWPFESSVAASDAGKIHRIHRGHTDLRPTRLALQNYSTGGACTESRQSASHLEQPAQGPAPR